MPAGSANGRLVYSGAVPGHAPPGMGSRDRRYGDAGGGPADRSGCGHTGDRRLFDIDAAAIGAGVISDGILCIIAGTWSINQVITNDPIVDKRIFLSSLYAVPGMWLTLEASPASATNLEWFVNNFCFEEKQEAQTRGISVYEVCNEKVASLAPGSTDIIFHPYLFVPTYRRPPAPASTAWAPGTPRPTYCAPSTRESCTVT